MFPRRLVEQFILCNTGGLATKGNLSREQRQPLKGREAAVPRRIDHMLVSGFINGYIAAPQGHDGRANTGNAQPVRLPFDANSSSHPTQTVTCGACLMCLLLVA